MSPREQLQTNLHDWIEMRSSSRFTAPYGVISSLEPVKNGKGKVRTVTFGVARYLDATLFIFGEKDIRCQAAGPMSPKLDGARFNSYDEVVKALEEL